jgi:predicted lipoprotein with Yx(FWY)xxD motif
MRKSGWTVATGLGSLLLLLTACGGSSSSSSATGAASGTVTQSTASSSSSSGPATSSSSAPAASATATHSASAAEKSAEPQPSATVTFLPIGTTVLIIQHSNLGWVMAKASGIVVYTYAKDSKGGPPTCTGSCASAWAPVTGMPKAGPVDNFPGTFGLVTGAGGVKQITYNGYPLYTLVGAPALSTKGNGLGGVWHVIILSAGDITGA